MTDWLFKKLVEEVFWHRDYPMAGPVLAAITLYVVLPLVAIGVVVWLVVL